MRKFAMKLTPMMQQYFSIKEKCHGFILFFRMGDFYEIFDQDALLVAPLLGIVLTSREKGDAEKVPFCGVPHHSSKNYYQKLLKLGYKVAIADQVENPDEAKGIVRREITKYLTPGMVEDLDGFTNNSEPNYFLALDQTGEDEWSVLISDISTGEIRLGSFSSIKELLDFIQLKNPKEILCRSFLSEAVQNAIESMNVGYKILISYLPEIPFRDSRIQDELLQKIFGSSHLDTMPCGKINGGKELVAGVMQYLLNLHFKTQQFYTIHPLFTQDEMTLDRDVISSLEIFETEKRKEKDGSLFMEINFTLSPMGTRYLIHSLTHPLISPHKLEQRKNFTSFLINIGKEKIKHLREQIRSFSDMERLTTKILNHSISPMDLCNFRSALSKVILINDWLDENDPKNIFLKMKKIFLEIEPIYFNLKKALIENPQSLGVGGQVFCEGFHSTLDQWQKLHLHGDQKLQEYENSLKQETGINSLKIKFHATYGHLIEVTKTNLTKVPSHFIRRQTMVNCERFVTVALQELSEEIASAQENLIKEEMLQFSNLLEQLNLQKTIIRQMIDALTYFDFLLSSAWLVLEKNYCACESSQENFILIENSRHPVIERFVGKEKFAPNHFDIDNKKTSIIITGPNMAGKSTYMRQLAISAILHQSIGFIPASRGSLPIYDQVFTRIGASDDLSRGQSTFMLEMQETAKILRHATHESLVILDEVGRGTSTTDGMAIAYAILKDLTERVHCHTLFSTHYHELVPYFESHSQVRLMQTEVLHQKSGILFTHRLIEGSCSSSYGIEVAKLAGVPLSVTTLAQNVIQEIR